MSMERRHNYGIKCTGRRDCCCGDCCRCYGCRFFRRSGSLYRGMQSRLKEKEWKSGPKQGQVRIAKRDLPFTLDQFRGWLQSVLEDEAFCCYCNCAISIDTISPDHYIPLKRGGSLERKNLRGACANCNMLKGQLMPGEFISLLRLIAQWGEDGRVDISRRLKGGTVRYLPAPKPALKASSVCVIPPQKKQYVLLEGSPDDY